MIHGDCSDCICIHPQRPPKTSTSPRINRDGSDWCVLIAQGMGSLQFTPIAQLSSRRDSSDGAVIPACGLLAALDLIEAAGNPPLAHEPLHRLSDFGTSSRLPVLPTKELQNRAFANSRRLEFPFLGIRLSSTLPMHKESNLRMFVIGLINLRAWPHELVRHKRGRPRACATSNFQASCAL